MDGLEKLEEQNKISHKVDNILENVDKCIPREFTKSQVAAILGLYLEIYR